MSRGEFGMVGRRGLTLVDLVVMMGLGAILAALVLPALEEGREEDWRVQCNNNLRQIGLAMHTYHDVHRMFPGVAVVGQFPPEVPANVSPNGYGGYSLLVSLLPYLTSQGLYNAVNFAGAIGGDDKRSAMFRAANATVAGSRMRQFVCPSDAYGGVGPVNNYFVNYGTWYAAAQREDGLITVVKPNQARTFGDVTDGTSATIAFAEVIKGSEFAPRERFGTVFAAVGGGGAKNPGPFRDHCQAIDWPTHAAWSSPEGGSGSFKGIARVVEPFGQGRPGGYRIGGWFETRMSVDRRSTGYNHVMPPNRLSCAWDGPRGGDVNAGMAASSNHPGGVNVVFLDDSVRFVMDNIDWNVWYSFGSINGGEKLFGDER